MFRNTRKLPKPKQHLISVALVVLVSGLCFFLSAYLEYKIVALILLMSVSLLAMFFEILPVLLGAVLSALILNFFFIPPLYTFHIENTEDILMFFMYFVIAFVNAVLTIKIREVEKKASDKEEKENSIKLYNTLINSLSHELKTPIATIIGAVDTLKESKDKINIQNQNELLDEIDIASIRLNSQVENLLNMNRLETGMLKLKLDWCDLNELIFGIIQKLELVSKKHNIVFNEDENIPLFRIDSGLLEQVIHNIVYNAIQYTPESSTITVNASFEHDNLHLSIFDNGIGFSENEIPLIFDKFYRSPNSKTGGTGLGLSISKGYVEAHNGKIKAENNFPKGAKFIIKIPAETTFINNLNNE